MIYFDEKEQCNKWKKNKLEAIAYLVGGDFSALGEVVTYNDGQTPPTDEEIEAEMTRLEAEWNTQEYARNRQTEYPPMADQLDYMFHNGFDKWKEDIVQPVKDKYPKPE